MGIDTARSNYLFAGQSAIDAGEGAMIQAWAARRDEVGPTYPAKYLATFTYRASNEGDSFLIQSLSQ